MSLPKAKTHLPFRDRSDKPVPRFGSLVQLLPPRVYRWVDSPLRRRNRWGIRKEKAALHQVGIAQERGWRVKVHPVEMGCRDSSTAKLLKEVGIKRQTIKTIKELATVAKRRAVAGCGWEEKRQHGGRNDHLAERGHPSLDLLSHPLSPPTGESERGGGE